ncbi:D-3-phosphoglycerate dehydrogenase [Breznakibacter xylanolyticus]|uniref:D-3-phosphoglycerate dehydrogenase n=1 Tax=Breznakibacter xylanolyticus TaxID=990 RepID=A0A2W7NUV9_9BACT|nr:3-phosphoglycerate dehydrogenase [Breznakibacter xylanolyticus]MBN2745071.1 3-phosphoglycerate dehydrogenase [Marinilabiliaceae bacterium]PZX20374.1 D-3-phosphoglycerate dehydrogenase [Breznakibacter xylanolyticus]
MKKVLVATDKPFAKIALDQIRGIVEGAGYQLALLEKYTTPQQLLDAVVDANAMIVRSDLITQEVVAAAKELKIVVRAGAGYDNLDLAACSAANVVAMNTPGQNANAVAELAFGMMVMLVRNNYNGTSGTELRGKKIGIHAYGNVGYYVAKIAKGFGMEVFAFDPFVSKEKMMADGVTPVATVEELYKTCQFVSLHIPATETTKKSINHGLLSLMPKGAMLINTARKEVIHEEDLVKLMSERADFRYVSDIEPGNKQEFADKFAGRYFFTPKKMGAQTEEANINAGVAAARQIVAFFEKGDETFRVNK